MLVMARKTRESVIVRNSGQSRGALKVSVVEIDGVHVKLAFELEGHGMATVRASPDACYVCQTAAGYLILDEPDRPQ